MSAEQSSIKDGNQTKNGPVNAIDLDELDPVTVSSIIAGPDGNSWVRLDLGQVHCIMEVEWHIKDTYESPLGWTCTATQCLCSGAKECGEYSLNVRTVGTDNLPYIGNCRYGDAVTFGNINGEAFEVREAIIKGKT